MANLLEKVVRPDLTCDDRHKWAIIKILHKKRKYTGYFNCSYYDYAYVQIGRSWYRLDSKYVSCRDVVNLDKVQRLVNNKEYHLLRIREIDDEIYDTVYKTKSCPIQKPKGA